MRVKCLAQEHNTMSPARTRMRPPRFEVIFLALALRQSELRSGGFLEVYVGDGGALPLVELWRRTTRQVAKETAK